MRIARLRDRAIRNRLDGQSGAFLDGLANEIESAVRHKEREAQEARAEEIREEDRREADQRQFTADMAAMEAQAEAEAQAQAEARAFADRKEAKRVLEREIIPQLTKRVVAFEQGEPFEYLQLVTLWSELRDADRLYERIDWAFAEIKYPLEDLRRRVEVLTDGFEAPPLEDFLDRAEIFFDEVDDASLADDVSWRLHELQIESPVDVPRELERSSAIRGAIEAYVPVLQTLGEEWQDAAQWGFVTYDAERPGFSYQRWVPAALARFAESEGGSEYLKGEAGLTELMRLLNGVKDQDSRVSYIAGLHERLLAHLRPLAEEARLQAELVESLVLTPEAIEAALAAHPFRIKGVELLPESAPNGLFERFRSRREQFFETRCRQARAVAELARRYATELSSALNNGPVN
jgi:hypothetical protein